MKNEKPILFNSEMVRAILDGRKTQTRRPVKFPLIDPDSGCQIAGCELNAQIKALNGRKMPFPGVGENLWVRETFGHNGCSCCPRLAFIINSL